MNKQVISFNVTEQSYVAVRQGDQPASWDVLLLAEMGLVMHFLIIRMLSQSFSCTKEDRSSAYEFSSKKK